MPSAIYVYLAGPLILGGLGFFGTSFLQFGRFGYFGNSFKLLFKYECFVLRFYRNHAIFLEFACKKSG